MSATLVTPKTTSGGEIIRELVNASDGAGLHFDGSAGYIDIASPPDLGTKFSFEFVVKADSWGGAGNYLLDFHSSSTRFVFGGISTNADNLGVYTPSTFSNFGVKVLDDLKVHHLVVTVDGTTAKLYDNGNEVGSTLTLTGSNQIDAATTLNIGKDTQATTRNLDGTIYRCRFYNKTLSSSEVQTAYERADVDFADQYGEQNLVDAAASAFTSGTYSWVAYGTNAIANVSNNLTITYSNNEQGAYNYLRDSSDLNQDLVVGKKYRLRITAKYAGGASGVQFELNNGATLDSLGALTTSFAEYVHEFTAGSGAASAYLRLDGLATGNVVTIDTWQVDEIGCVSDYDLAFANENQSVMVADRSTNNVDGEMSSSGVKQTQVIKQLNSTAMRVGGTSATAATPADGELLASGNIGSGSADPNIGGWGNAITIDNSGAAALEFAKSGTLYGFVGVQGSGSGNAFDVAAYQSQDMRFRVGSNAGTTAMTIDSSGRLGVGNSAPSAPLEVSQSQSSTVSTISTFSTADAEHSVLALKKSSSATVGTKAVTADGEILGRIDAYGVDTNSNQRRGAQIEFNQAAAATGSKVAGNIVFKTSSTSANDVTALTIDSTGDVTVGQGGTASAHTKLTIDGTSAANRGPRLAFGREGDPKGLIGTESGLAGNDSDDLFIFAETGNAVKIATGGSTTPRLTISSTGLATFSDGVTVSGGFLSLDTSTELTIASGAVTVTRSFHDVDTEGDAATDDLDTINGGSAGDILTLKTVTGSRDVTVKDATGNLRLAGDFTLTSPNDTITLIKYSTVWIETSRSDNV